MVSLLGNYALHCVSYTLDNSHEWLILSINKNSSQVDCYFCYTRTATLRRYRAPYGFCDEVRQAWCYNDA